MKNYNFELIFKIPNKEEDINIYIDKLFENDWDDATISTGQLGFLALSFTREAPSANEAI